MYCSNCGKEIDDDAVFCPFCGNSVKPQTEAPETEPETRIPEPAPEKIHYIYQEEPVYRPAPQPPQKRKKKSPNAAPWLVLTAIVLLAAVLCIFGVKTGRIVLPFANGTDSAATASSAAESQTLQAGNAQNGKSESASRTEISAASGTESTVSGSGAAAPAVPAGTVKNDGSTTSGTVSSPAIAPSAITPAPVASPSASVHRYQLVVKDLTWEEAYEEAKNAGGYLAHFDSADELNKVAAEYLNTESVQKLKLWIGGRRDADSGNYYWIQADGSFDTTLLNSPAFSSCWYPGEPSFRDSSLNLDEMYMEMFYYQDAGKWVWNDAPDNIIAAVSSYAGSVGYLEEFDQ